MLWRRERRKSDSGETYVEGTSPNSILVRHSGDSPCVSNVLYTDFHAVGKIDKLDARELATRAIESIQTAENGKDGISYLLSNLAAGIETPLTPAYKAEILRQTKTESLENALNGIVKLRPQVAEYADDEPAAQLSRIPIPLRNHQSRRLALLPFRLEFPRCRRSPCRTGYHRDI